MLLIMTVVNKSIPPEAGMTVFRIDNLSGGIAVFGLSFVMLFAALLLSYVGEAKTDRGEFWG